MCHLSNNDVQNKEYYVTVRESGGDAPQQVERLEAFLTTAYTMLSMMNKKETPATDGLVTPRRTAGDINILIRDMELVTNMLSVDSPDLEENFHTVLYNSPSRSDAGSPAEARQRIRNLIRNEVRSDMKLDQT
jgi:hypothetical protein